MGHGVEWESFCISLNLGKRARTRLRERERARRLRGAVDVEERRGNRNEVDEKGLEREEEARELPRPLEFWTAQGLGMWLPLLRSLGAVQSQGT